METTIQKKPNEEIKELVTRISDGTATEQEYGVALKQLQISLATSMLNELSESTALLSTLKETRQRLMDRLEEIVITDIAIMDADTVMNLLKELTKMNNDNLEFKRRVIQGKSIFEFETLNDEEKLVVQLMKSFASLSEKQEFLEIVKSKLSEKQS